MSRAFRRGLSCSRCRCCWLAFGLRCVALLEKEVNGGGEKLRLQIFEIRGGGLLKTTLEFWVLNVADEDALQEVGVLGERRPSSRELFQSDFEVGDVLDCIIFADCRELDVVEVSNFQVNRGWCTGRAKAKQAVGVAILARLCLSSPDVISVEANACAEFALDERPDLGNDAVNHPLVASDGVDRKSNDKLSDRGTSGSREHGSPDFLHHVERDVGGC